MRYVILSSFLFIQDSLLVNENTCFLLTLWIQRVPNNDQVMKKCMSHAYECKLEVKTSAADDVT